MEIRNAQDFAMFLRWYAEKHGLTRTAFAKIVGRPHQTVGHWFIDGIKPEPHREKIMAEFPEIFSESRNMPRPANNHDLLAATSIDHSKQMTLVMKVELGRQGTLILSDILEWFINSTPEERHRFREELGEIWKNFLELTRAMTGEQALKMAVQERRVHVNND